jgi:biopolymer transport protein ExbB/TolQ
MKNELVSVKVVTAAILILFTVQVSDCYAQKNATKRFEKETFGSSRRGKAVKESGESRAAEKAMKEQAKKEARRDREDAKALKEMRARHYEIQSEGTKLRMENNSRNTADKYKTKRQKQRKEQTEPELKKPRQPVPDRAGPKPKTKDPAKQPELKQQKKKAKTVDPKKQPRLKQHKIRK